MTKGASNQPSNSDLYTVFSLYARIDLPRGDVEETHAFIEDVKKPEGPIDAYCPQCQRLSTFTGYPVRTTTILKEYDESIDDTVFGVEFRCIRNPQHRMLVFFRCVDNVLIKIGQYPSVADLSESQIGQYRKLLGNEKYRELARAIGLKSHGVGVGAFIYLRRIFEDLIEDAHKQAQQRASWDEEAFQKCRMDARIAVLAEFLPPFIVENRSVYSILSKGIHCLSEDECLQYFDAVLAAIELILDEVLEQRRRSEKTSRAKKSLEAIRQEIQN